MENLQVFSSEEFGEVRVIEIDNEPWFVGKDIVSALGYTGNTSKLFTAIPEQWKDVKPIHTLGGTQNMLCLSEQGLYFFLGRSDKKGAIPYQMFIAGEVMPSIRKNGGYIVGQDNLSDDELLAKALLVAQNKIAERDKRIAEQQKVIEEKSQVIEQQTPLVEFANHVSSATESIEIGTLAKLANKQGIEIGRNRLFNWLRDKKYLMQNNEPYQQYVNQGYFKLIEKTNNTPYGPTIYTQTLVTGKGQIWIIEQLRKEFGSK